MDENDIPHIVQAVEFIWQNAGSQSTSDAVVTSSLGSPVKKRLKSQHAQTESWELFVWVGVGYDSGKKEVDTSESTNNHVMEIECVGKVKKKKQNVNIYDNKCIIRHLKLIISYNILQKNGLTISRTI